MKISKFILIALVLCSSAGTKAQTLAEVIAPGLEHNYNPKIARNEEAISLNKATVANAAMTRVAKVFVFILYIIMYRFLEMRCKSNQLYPY